MLAEWRGASVVKDTVSFRGQRHLKESAERVRCSFRAGLRMRLGIEFIYRASGRSCHADLIPWWDMNLLNS